MAKELTATEIRTLIRGHNKMSQIKVPSGLNKDGLIKFLKSRKYKVDHVKKRLVDLTTGNSRGRITTLATAKDITKPKPKTDAQKQKAVESKAKKDEAKAKELKLARKEGVKEFKQKKAEATKKPAQKKPTPKPKPDAKKPPMKKEDVYPRKPSPPKLPPRNKKKPPPLPPRDKVKPDTNPYQTTSDSDSDLEEQISKLNDYFVKDKNKIGKTFKTVKEVEAAVSKLFKTVPGAPRGQDPFKDLDASETKSLLKLINNMLRFSTKEETGFLVKRQLVRGFKGFYSEAALAQGIESQRKRDAATPEGKEKAKEKKDKAKPKITIGAKPKGGRIETGTLNKGKVVSGAKNKPKVATAVTARALARKEARKSKKVITFDYKEVSGHSDMLKKALKETYDLANSSVNKVLSLKPKDFVETEQLSSFFGEAFPPMNDDLNEDEDEIYDPIYDKLNMDLDKKLKEILDKNRKETNWTKAKPALRPMQDKYVEAMKKFKESNKPADFKVAKKQKDLILKHYKASDVPRV